MKADEFADDAEQDDTPATTWNHRILTWDHRILDASDENGGEPWLMLVECHYEGGVPIGYSEICTGEETIEALRTACDRLRAACDMPILKKSDFRK